MRKYVRSLISIAFLLCLAGAFPVSSPADFFNDRLIKDRSEDVVLRRRILDGAYFGESGVPQDTTAVYMRPPKEIARPNITFSDSIRSESSHVKQYREIEGLGDSNPYRVMTFDQYIKDNLENNFYNKWLNTKERMKTWKDASGERSGGITDLDFVLPGSKKLERFVGGKTRINIDGREKITFSGRSEWTEGQVETSVSKNSSFPSLTMKQEPQFRINGDVGRIKIDIKQDPQSGQFSNLEDNINIKYEGEERDIIKYVEAGNTSLSLEGATFAGYRGSHKGLFGIRAEGQLGPMKFTTIASQEKSEANVKTFRGKAEESSNKIYDYQYKRNTYFYLDEIYRQRFFNNRDSFDLIQYVRADSIEVIEVFEDDANVNNNLQQGTFALRGSAYPIDMQSGSGDTDYAIEGHYHKLEPLKDYYVDRSLGYIRFLRRVPDQSTIGVYIRTKDGREFGSLAYDTEDPNTKIELKLIKKVMQLPTDTHTWDLEWKNVYDLGQRPIEPDGLEIRVYRDASDGVSRDTQDGTPFIQILGLDKKDETGSSVPDNRIDLNRGFINFYNGELMFPDPEPFNPRGPLPGVSTGLTEKIEKIYNTQNQEEMREASRYYIEVKTASRQSTIQIGSGFMGIMEGTEQVILNGKSLSKGKDYRIDYNTGRITLLNEEAQSPTADLQIRYEEPNAFQEMQKTLLGFRTEFDVFTNSRIGAVTLFKNESTQDRRVKLGQEPSRMFLFDTDAQFNFDSRTVTNMLDKLPGLQASERSTFKIETEFARSMPTLNTRGVVYIDDFEGSQNIPINVIRSKWTLASPPDSESLNGITLKRGRLQWYNPWNRVKSKDIWPNKETSAGENTVHVLSLGYGKPQGATNAEGYAGIMTSFFGAGEDLSRARFVEIWARGAKGDLKVDIGSISEDYYPLHAPNGVLDTEDRPIPGQGHGDGILTKKEDTGLDLMFDDQEKVYYQELAAETTDPVLKNKYLERAASSDPSGDNFFYKSGDKNNYTGINGGEGNASDGDRLGFPDTEDINNNGILDTLNKYYEYTMSFSDPHDPYLVRDSVPEGEPHGWRLFRIPLWNNPKAITGGLGAPDSTLIKSARLWLTNTDSTLVQIASIQIVESAWIEQGIEGDNILGDQVRVTNVNTHENLDYTPPPGVKAEIDRKTKIRKKEQSLVLQVENLQPGNSGYIYRNFQEMNLTNYTALRMYVHGPDDFPTIDGEGDTEIVLRFGADKDNYYEYRSKLYKGWDNRNHVDIDFTKCTGLKLLPWNSSRLLPSDEVDASDPWYDLFQTNPDSINATMTTWYDAFLMHGDFVKAVEDTVGNKVYSLKGRPSLDKIKLISIGVKNGSDYKVINGDVWVNELRMDSERDMTGHAARVDINTNLAGFMSIVAGATRKEDDFHDMNSKSGTGEDQTDWKANASMNLDRFTPKRWNLRLPVSASINESSSLPRLKSGSDIILNQDQKKDFESTNSDKKYRVSYSKSRDTSKDIVDSFEDFKTLSFGKVGNTMMHWALDKVDASFDYGERSSESPFSGESLSNDTQAKLTYDVNPQDLEKKVKLFNWLPVLPFERYEKFADMEFSLAPSQMNYSYTFSEKNQYKTNVDAVSDTTQNKTADTVLNFGYDPFDGLRYTFTRRTGEDLILKQQVKYDESNKISLTGPTLFYLQNSFSYSADYNETDNPRYSLSSQLGSKRIRLAKSFSINGSLDWNKFIEDISGKPKPPRQKFQREKKQDEEWDGSESEGDGEKEKKDLDSKPEKPKEKKDNDDKDKKDQGKDGDKPEEKKGPGLRTKLLMGVSRSLSPISLDYSTTENVNYSGIKDRPGFMTRFGQGAVSEPDSMTVVTQSNSLAQTTSYSAQTKINLPLDMGVSLDSKYSTNDNMSPSANRRSDSATPLNVSFNWSGLERKIPFVNKYMKSLTLTSGYNVNQTKEWQSDMLRSEKNASKFSPLFSLNTRLFDKLQISFSYNAGTNSTDDFSSDTKSRSERSENSTSTQIRYAISSKDGIPFLKGLKLNSNIDLSMTFGTNSSEEMRGIGDKPMAKVSSNDSWSFGPKAEYKFSSKFRGGMHMNFRNRIDMTEKTTKTREVSIWGEMIF